MVRAIAAVAAGLVVWTLIATLGNLAMRASWPSYVTIGSAR